MKDINMVYGTGNDAKRIAELEAENAKLTEAAKAVVDAGTSIEKIYDARVALAALIQEKE